MDNISHLVFIYPRKEPIWNIHFDSPFSVSTLSQTLLYFQLSSLKKHYGPPASVFLFFTMSLLLFGNTIGPWYLIINLFTMWRYFVIATLCLYLYSNKILITNVSPASTTIMLFFNPIFFAIKCCHLPTLWTTTKTKKKKNNAMIIYGS